MVPAHGDLPAALTLLLIEPSRILLEPMWRLASECGGIAAAVTTTLEGALAQLGACTFDVVVVDLGYSRLAAADSLRRLRAAAPRSYLVAMAADGEPESAAVCFRSGADRVLSIGACQTLCEELMVVLGKRAAAPA